jgi:spermidine synthase
VTFVLYLLFFLSGGAALVYEVTWVRSLSLVFGGSHLAVTTVLAVYMGGLALGSALFGKRADASRRPLRLYGALEIGIAAFALVFLGLSRAYPALYVPLARLAEENRLWLSAVRVAFAVVALLAPTTLMGGTLPLLSRLVAGRSRSLGRHLSFLYGFNTLGAVAGSLAAGFVLLRALGVTASLLAAAAVNLAVGLAAVLLPERAFEAAGPGEEPGAAAPVPAEAPEEVPARSYRLVLWGIGVSGFCALGYEVLWTRLLSMVVGTSVYGFTIMLVAFLAGIALGSHAYGLLERRRPGGGTRRAVVAFGLVEVAIGIAALAVTLLMSDLPTHATRLQGLLAGGASEFGARQGASFAVAFAYMLVPAFFMGVAFPLAGSVHAASRQRVGAAVGDVLAWNTVGAILGSAVSGFALIYAFGIERSLQMLSVVNVGVGLAVAASVLRPRVLPGAVAAAAVALLVALAALPHWGRAWDMKYFAIFRNNQRGAFDIQEKIQDALENTEVLYYLEGANETISVIRPRGARQAFIVNGRPEATTSPMDVQCQRTLGHLPMLLHPDPRKVFVLGTGTGMTLGATSIHPEVERIVLAEIEPGVLGAARTFAPWNHGVLDDSRLHVVFNDGRNYLATTRETFDVITADPIHPWSGGAAYLYTREYFDGVARHLRPGGIACQWLPIYELTPGDVRSVVRTFAGSFRHVMIWLTHYDAELVGSDAPLVLDEARLARRLAQPTVARDLEVVQMGTAEDFLSYFVAGTEGARAFARGGVVNTDDNLFLEFSAPESMGVGRLMGDNVAALAVARESLLPYLAPAPAAQERESQAARWERSLAAGRLYDRAHALFLWGQRSSPEFLSLAGGLERGFPGYAPYRFLRQEIRREAAATPRLAEQAAFPVLSDGGAERLLRVSAVTMHVGETRAAVVLVDNDRRDIYGQRYLDAGRGELDAAASRFAGEAIAALRATYQDEAAEARRRGQALPAEARTVARLKERVARIVTEPPR